MELDGPLAFAELSPWEKREAKIDGGRIEGIGRLLQFYAEIVSCIQHSGSANQHLSEFGVNAPIPFLVGFCQSAASNFAPNACMIEFGL